jgi:hypothetical protein
MSLWLVCDASVTQKRVTRTINQPSFQGNMKALDSVKKKWLDEVLSWHTK